MFSLASDLTNQVQVLKKIKVIFSFFLFIIPAQNFAVNRVITGASQVSEYLPLLKNKNVAIVGNQSSLIDSVHLVDTLKSLKINIQCVFAPEHGFRGQAEAGESVYSGKDAKTGIKVVSLYGSNKKPRPEQLKNIDIVIFDLQDVGTRFYTYISTLQYVMEACAAANIPVLVLDRPNPHGGYVDGPVLKNEFRSFVGMQRIPVVHGMTMGEYAAMLNGESLLENKIKCNLQVIKIKNYDHNTGYDLPVKPSPNLPGMTAVRLYPSLCFFEGTAISVGRGTEIPFQIIGYPGNPSGDFKFTPQSIPGMAKDPMYSGIECNGFDLRDFADDVLRNPKQIVLTWLLQTYKEYPEKDKYFNKFFDTLAGTDQLRIQITEGWTEEQIRNSWAEDILSFKIIRKKYLLYKDFE